MDSSDIQIKKAYEEANMTPSQIAEDLGFQEIAVKSKLMQISTIFRRACGAEPLEECENNFTEDQLRQVNDVIFQTAIGAEDEHLRLKAAMYVRDDKKGRKEVVKAVQHTNNFNLVTFNETLQQAKQQAAQVKQALTGQKAINI